MTPNRSRFVNRAYCPHRCRGFTIVEMLLVIGIIMLMLAIMLPSLSAVQNRSRKSTELNYLRQVGMAWNMYGNQHNDAAIPGYLDHQGEQPVQDRWRVRFEYPALPLVDGVPVSADPSIPHHVSAPWTWRLAEYFDYNAEVLWGYRRDAMNDVQSLVNSADQVALEPAFGYNAYYIGGWWRVVAGEGEESTTRPRFAHYDAVADGRPVSLVVRTLSTMAKPERLVIFSAATQHTELGLNPGVHNDRPGSHLVTPPTVAEDAKWRVPRAGGAAGGDLAVGSSNRYTIEVLEAPAHAPLARHNNFVAVLHGDNSTATEVVGELSDQRRWINGLSTFEERAFTHTGTYWP